MCDIETLRLFIHERLSAVAEDILSVFVRTLVDYQRQLEVLNTPTVKTQDPDFFPACEEEVSSEHQERSDRAEAYGSTFPVLAVKCEDGDESKETEPVASTSTQHMTTQADVKDCGTSQPTGEVQVLSSLSSESDNELTEDSDEWEETRGGDQSALKTLKSHKTQHVDGQILPLRNKLSREDPESSKQTLPSSHMGEKSFTLPFSGKSFDQSRHPKSHMRIDAGEQCFSCTFCGRGFSQMSNLKKHTMTHTGEKPFWCTVCGKTFNQKVNLKTHFRVHTGEKPFSCTVCAKSFNQHGTLKMHMRVHTGEKPFSCSICGKSFSQRGVLKSHMMGIHVQGSQHGHEIPGNISKTENSLPDLEKVWNWN